MTEHSSCPSGRQVEIMEVPELPRLKGEKDGR